MLAVLNICTFFQLLHNIAVVLKFSFCVTELHDAVFVVGALDETVMLRGMRYHPIDIENSVMRCHKKIAEW